MLLRLYQTWCGPELRVSVVEGAYIEIDAAADLGVARMLAARGYATPSAGAALRRCPIPGCERPVDLGLVMCPEHWIQVPHALRMRVHRHHQLLRTAEFADAIAHVRHQATVGHADNYFLAQAAYVAACRAAIESVTP